MEGCEESPWRAVSVREFDAFLRAYPGILLARPPEGHGAEFRAYADPELGSWPENVVAVWHRGEGHPLFEIREDALADVKR